VAKVVDRDASLTAFLILFTLMDFVVKLSGKSVPGPDFFTDEDFALAGAAFLTFGVCDSKLVMSSCEACPDRDFLTAPPGVDPSASCIFSIFIDLPAFLPSFLSLFFSVAIFTLFSYLRQKPLTPVPYIERYWQ
jgi:hypothetical protein